MMDQAFGDEHKERASYWFEKLRDDICLALEAIEDDIEGPNISSEGVPGRFERKSWKRQLPDGSKVNGGGGTISVLRGRVFEKAAVNISTVFGKFSEEFRGAIPGTTDDPRFWASGISVVVHPLSPLVPAAHMNTRMIVTSKQWFGGGADLTPMKPVQEDTDSFHSGMRGACDRADESYYPKYKKWCDEYFYLSLIHI